MSDLTELFTWTCSRCDDLTEVWFLLTSLFSLIERLTFFSNKMFRCCCFWFLVIVSDGLFLFEAGIWSDRYNFWCQALLTGAFFIAYMLKKSKFSLARFIYIILVVLCAINLDNNYEYALQGFVGMAKDLNAIVIAFRGTQERRFEDACGLKLLVFLLSLWSNVFN